MLILGLRFKFGRQRSTTLECIVACFAIHNLLLERGENNPPPPDEDLIARFYPQADEDEAPIGRRNRGNTVRTTLINTHFTTLAER
ncbi:hypothetical protein ANN_14264 [Periplaneta americana]|uniref:DDE Tnp4 domain-containing protein n=1 Tax=Periplaneta americana TaxID=6978 RepID=A0ABQ8SXB0_PERAM|nr:hypothetical protein ANN_14264 [Periplaneta americana]